MLPTKSFPALIRWLADTHHDGVISAMADRTGLSTALMDKWVKGRVKQPDVTSLVALCRAYDLKLVEVLALVSASTRRPRRPPVIAGGSAIDAPLSAGGDGPITGAPGVRTSGEASAVDRQAKCPLFRKIMSGFSWNIFGASAAGGGAAWTWTPTYCAA